MIQGESGTGKELVARAVTEPKPGVHIFDLGQNFAGIIRLHVRGAAGTSVRLRYGEMLHRDGTLMTENLRRARATDTYILTRRVALRRLVEFVQQPFCNTVERAAKVTTDSAKSKLFTVIVFLPNLNIDIL